MEVIVKFFERLGNVMRVAGCVCLLSMSLVTVADITGRFNKQPIFGSEEMVAFLGVLALGLALPYAHAHRSHIGVEVVIQLLSTRVRRWLKLFRDVLSFLFFLLTTVMMAKYGRATQLSGEVSMNLGLPEYLLIYALAACFAVVTMAMLVDFVLFLRDWRRT